MRIEVLVANGEPDIYPLSKPEITIGTGESCDIIVNGQGISRKHVKVSVGQDQFFVIDQGSTNGTFINEERLVPGRKVEFTSFFPVRLGDNVLLTLLSDEDTEGETLRDFTKKVEALASSEPKSESDATRTISLNELSKVKTNELVKKRQSAQVAKKKEDPRKKKSKQAEKSLTRPLLIALAIIAGAYYFHRSNQEAERVAEEARVKALAEEKAKALAVIKPAPTPAAPSLKIATEYLISKEKLNSYFMDLVCTNPAEMAFCDAIPYLREGRNGVIQVGTSFVFLISQKEWLDKGIKLFPGEQTLTTTDSVQQPTNLNGVVIDPATPEQVYRMAFISFLKEKFMNLDKKQVQGKDLYFAFYQEKTAGTPEISKVFALTSNALLHVINNYTSDLLLRQLKRQNYVRAFRDLESYITFY